MLIAKEKLWLITKNTNLPWNMSNDWKLNININKIKLKEEEDNKELLNKVKKIELITKETESILINQSIYSDVYRPKYIEEMNDINKIKELSKVIQDRLRNVKLAVSKANLNYNKMLELSKKQKIESEKFNKAIKKRRIYKSAYPKYLYNKSPLIDGNLKISLRNKNKNNEDIINKSNEKEKNENNSLIKDNLHISQKDIRKNLIQPINIKKILPELKSKYAMDRTKLRTPNDMFNKYQIDFSQGYKAIFRPFKKLFKKTKDTQKHIIRVKSSIIPQKNKNNLFDEDFEKYILLKKKKINILEKCLKKLEANSSI